jgi:NAD(P)-dependent dehydrogenase (short-subunit alcohol dehydrogenase family)
MAGKHIILITGANTGIGLEVVKALYNSDASYEILMGSRSVDKANDAVATLKHDSPSSKSNLSSLQVDISSDDSIRKAFEQVKSQHGRLDTLVNNAGASFDHAAAQGQMTLREAFNASWDVNVSGTHVMTHEFAPLLLKSSSPRLLFVTSGTSALAETERFDYPPLARLNASPDAGWPKAASMNPVTSYRSSKTGLNMLMREWAKILKNDGVKVFAISPGFLATGLAGVGAEQLKKVSGLRVRDDDNVCTDLELYRWALGIHPKVEHSSVMLWRAREIKMRARRFALR